MKIEPVDIYDENKKKTGKIKMRYRDSLEKGEYALAARAIIINSKNEILLSRRALDKKHGGLWEANGGNALAGENSKECIIREIKEELGLDITNYDDILFKETISKTAPVFDDIYVYRIDVDIKKIHHNSEVMHVKWVSIDEYEDMNNKGLILHYHEFTKEDYIKVIEVQEFMDVYDENKKITGKIINRKDRKKLNKNEFVICVHCWIINSKKEILMSQRSMNMNNGGKWEDTHGGLRAGESSVDGIKRELKEELGIDVKDNELNLIETIKEENIFRDCYIVYKDISIESIKFNDGEVMNCKYVTLDELKEIIQNEESSIKKFSNTIFYRKNLI